MGGRPAEVKLAPGGFTLHGTHSPLAAAEHAVRYCPTAHGDVSHAEQAAPFFQYPGEQVAWQLWGSPCRPGLVKTELASALVHAAHCASESARHWVRNRPTGHGAVLHGAQASPLRKKPASQAHAHRSAVLGLPAVEKCAFAGFAVHGTQRLPAAEHWVRY